MHRECKDHELLLERGFVPCFLPTSNSVMLRHLLTTLGSHHSSGLAILASRIRNDLARNPFNCAPGSRPAAFPSATWVDDRPQRPARLLDPKVLAVAVAHPTRWLVSNDRI